MSQTNPSAEQVALPPISVERLQTTYANFVRGLMTAEEIILDFGFNPNNGGRIVDEPVAVSSRVVLSPASAARLYQLLHALLAKRQEAVQQAQAQAAESSPPTATPPA